MNDDSKPYISFHCLPGVQGADKSRSRPEFLGPVPNATVAVGRDAVLPCVVKNLQDYKVSGGKKKSIANIIFDHPNNKESLDPLSMEWMDAISQDEIHFLLAFRWPSFIWIDKWL